MLEYIKGNIAELTPTQLILEQAGIGYAINISLFSYTQLQGATEVQIFLHQVIREDAHLLFGFFSQEERKVFRLLISVSGVGANTARMILSSMSPDEAQHAIADGNVALLQSIKGIGAKSAQRIIVDLKDKVVKSSDSAQLFKPADNTLKKEALSALEILGFGRKQAEKVIDKLLSAEEEYPVEDLIKKALKLL
ncbi:MAG: Holliday junction branch migration protein RuvA [Bacteroidales bacterium]|nr:Holliday junction branch migration protein RuvA [Bacteroidales bacterium]